MVLVCKIPVVRHICHTAYLSQAMVQSPDKQFHTVGLKIFLQGGGHNALVRYHQFQAHLTAQYVADLRIGHALGV